MYLTINQIHARKSLDSHMYIKGRDG